jgi:glucose-6-phosphate isomerase
LAEFQQKPFTFNVVREGVIHPDPYDSHIIRWLADLRGQFFDQTAYKAMLAQADPVLYEVYEVKRPTVEGELLQGFSIVHPGKVGNEYYMTKGHYHRVLETSEVYYCLQGEGFMVMETPEGEWAVESLRANACLYVPPRWTHRSVNTHPILDLITFFVYPAHAGHDYGSIEKQGFRKLVIEKDGAPTIVDNPRWLPPEAR